MQNLIALVSLAQAFRFVPGEVSCSFKSLHTYLEMILNRSRILLCSNQIFIHIKEYISVITFPKTRTVGIAQGSPNFFARGPHKLLHNSSRAGHIT